MKTGGKVGIVLGGSLVVAISLLIAGKVRRSETQSKFLREARLTSKPKLWQPVTKEIERFNLIGTNWSHEVYSSRFKRIEGQVRVPGVWTLARPDYDNTRTIKVPPLGMHGESFPTNVPVSLMQYCVMPGQDAPDEVGYSILECDP